MSQSCKTHRKLKCSKTLNIPDSWHSACCVPGFRWLQPEQKKILICILLISLILYIVAIILSKHKHVSVDNNTMFCACQWRGLWVWIRCRRVRTVDQWVLEPLGLRRRRACSARWANSTKSPSLNWWPPSATPTPTSCAASFPTMRKG